MPFFNLLLFSCQVHVSLFDLFAELGSCSLVINYGNSLIIDSREGGFKEMIKCPHAFLLMLSYFM